VTFLFSGFGGLEVACWPLVPKFAGSNLPETNGFFGRKNPQHAFLRRWSKAVCPMSCFMACKRTQKWRGSRHFRQNSLGHFSPIIPPSAAGFASVTSDAGGLLWRKLERSKSLFSSKLGVWRTAGNGTLENLPAENAQRQLSRPKPH
jgi:hypothetical protein